MNITQNKTNLAIGDVVKVRADLHINKEYNGCSVVVPMRMLAGELVTINGYKGSITNDRTYEEQRYKVKGSVWSWSNDMFDREPPTDFELFLEEVNRYAR